MAGDGLIEVSGIRNGSSQHEKIDRLFWKNAAIDPLESMKEENGGGVAQTEGFGSSVVRYRALIVERAALEKLWPGVTTFSGKPDFEPRLTERDLEP